MWENIFYAHIDLIHFHLLRDVEYVTLLLTTPVTLLTTPVTLINTFNFIVLV